MIIGLVGKKGSGKETVGKIIAELAVGKKTAAIRFSDPLSEVCDTMFIPKTRHNLQHLAVVLDGGFGKGTLTKAVYQRIKSTQADIIILDGIRWATDYDMLRQLPGSILIHVDVDLQTRFERIRQRKEKAGEAGVPFEQFLQEDQAENEIYIDEIATKADYVITNNGTLEELREQLKKFMDKYL